MANLAEQITDGWKAAMRSGDGQRRDTLNMLRAAIKNAEINARTAGAGSTALTDAEVQQVIEREAKKRRDAIDEYNKANRPDRAAGEEAELGVLLEFLPAQLTDDELDQLTSAAIAEAGAASAADMGKVMKVLLPKVAGRADGKRTSAAVKKLLS